MKNNSIHIKLNNCCKIFSKGGSLYFVNTRKNIKFIIAETPDDILDFIDIININKLYMTDYAYKWANNNNYYLLV
ncbi:MAG: hypothetical protein AABY22_33700 [Nanoarchaeota archaeon]